MDNNSLRMGYVMVSRALLLDIYGKRGAADGEEEAFLRVLTHVNYRDTTVLHGGVQVACGRGESVISFLGRSAIWNLKCLKMSFATHFCRVMN